MNSLFSGVFFIINNLLDLNLSFFRKQVNWTINKLNYDEFVNVEKKIIFYNWNKQSTIAFYSIAWLT